MKILIVGSGAREHAIAWKLAQNSGGVEKVFFSSHNGGATGKLENLNLPNNDTQTIRTWLASHAVDLVIIGPENPLNDGIVDQLTADGVKVFGPQKPLPGWKAVKPLPKLLCKSTISQPPATKKM